MRYIFRSGSRWLKQSCSSRPSIVVLGVVIASFEAGAALKGPRLRRRQFGPDEFLRGLPGASPSTTVENDTMPTLTQSLLLDTIRMELPRMRRDGAALASDVTRVLVMVMPVAPRL